MTSPEWEAANEDDSDRFPQTSHASAPESTESHEQGSRVVPDPARVARYAEAIADVINDALEESDPGWEYTRPTAAEDWTAEARAVVAVADEEHAALVAENERLREERDWHHARADVLLAKESGRVALRGGKPGDYWAEWHRTHCAAVDLVGVADAALIRMCDRAESAESALAVARAQVEAVRALHQADDRFKTCIECRQGMPCDTLLALSSAAAGTPEPARPDTASEGDGE